MTSVLRVESFYWDLRNKIIAPERNLLVSHYFLDRWAPVLGPNYTALVLQLRRVAAEGPARGIAEVPQEALAQRLGFSRRKLQRLLAPEEGVDSKTWFIPLFLRVEHQWLPGGANFGRSVNRYRVAIDDPLHPDDDSSLLPQVAPREVADLLHQGLEPLPVPSPVLDDDLQLRLRSELPELVTAAIQNLLVEVGPDEMRQQLDWLPHRDTSWAHKGPAAAYYTYCRQREPEPEILQRHSRLVAQQRAYEEVRDTAQAAAAVPAPSDAQLLAFLSHLPDFHRQTFGSHLKLKVHGTTVRLSCEQGFTRLLRPHLQLFRQAAKTEFGPEAQLELEAQ